MRLEMHNLDGRGDKRTHVYDMTPREDYWSAVTDVTCPCCGCFVRWAEAGYVAGVSHLRGVWSALPRVWQRQRAHAAAGGCTS
jgi:hypothetical protein